MTTPRKFCAMLMTAFAMVSVGSIASAYESKYVEIRMNQDCKGGGANDIRGSFRLKNVSGQIIQLEPGIASGDAYQFRLITEQRVLKPDEETNVYFKGFIRQDGKFQVNMPVGISIGDTFHTEQVADMYFAVARGIFVVSSYEELYLKPDDVDKEMGNSFNGAPDDANIGRGEEYKQPMPSVDQMIKMDPKSIYRIPLDSAPNGCGGGGCNYRKLKDFKVSDIQLDPKVSAAATVVASGVFSWKGMDNLLHPAFGWRVKAWQRIIGGIWVVVAEDWVQWDGHWTLNVPIVPIGSGDTRFQYVAFNRFFTPQSSSGDTYRWVGPIRSGMPSVHNEGSWFADTSSGNARGLGEIYREGMTMWSKMYWEGEINPLRGSSIQVFFPNTTYDCGDGTGSPWSCASRDGRIWLIPSHASRNGVMQHELAHQINYEYWNNDIPSGSGGSHNLTNCYNPALAEIEGFANFMVFWVQAGRTSDPSTGFDFRPEDPSFACASPLAKNESWVAAAFWDLHDQHGDGSDNLWFIHPGATPAIFLRTGKRNGLNDFWPVYRAAANPEHRTIIDAIFQQNKIIP
jgi:hypothetical protein